MMMRYSPWTYLAEGPPRIWIMMAMPAASKIVRAKARRVHPRSVLMRVRRSRSRAWRARTDTRIMKNVRKWETA
jgi:Tfp pilus assembly protein FimT